MTPPAGPPSAPDARQDNDAVTARTLAALREDPKRLVYLVRPPLYVATDERMIAKLLKARFIDFGVECDVVLEKAGFESFALRVGPVQDARAHALVAGIPQGLEPLLDATGINVIGNITPILNCPHPETTRIPDIGAAFRALAGRFRIVLIVPGTIQRGKIHFISEVQPFSTEGVAVIGPDLTVVGRKI